MRERAKINRTRTLVLCAVFAAVSAAASPWVIPVGPVPVGLTHISVFLSAAVLGAKRAAASQAVFVALGAAGVPVFSGFEGGLGKIAGPTGGFIAGYVFAAFVAGLVIERFGRSYPALFLGMYAGWAATYAVGLPWFMLVTGSGIVQAFVLCVLPFLVPDAVKTVICAALARRIDAARLEGENL
ncbi:MAG: biotin transporter BioY [Oscillospiraceae bacterium]|nr:biotin transporter BioY [Oscillospiraceae bacterium]